MTDIVERLREGVFGSDETKTDTVIHAHMQVAAAEIERLRTENAALRAALQWMVDNDETNEGDEPMPEYGGQTWNGINAYYIAGLNRARDALGQGRHDKPAALLEDGR